jgi:hypothetical protein
MKRGIFTVWSDPHRFIADPDAGGKANADHGNPDPQRGTVEIQTILISGSVIVRSGSICLYFDADMDPTWSLK